MCELKVWQKGEFKGEFGLDGVTRTLTGEGCAVTGSCKECCCTPDLVSPWKLFGSNALNS